MQYNFGSRESAKNHDYRIVKGAKENIVKVENRDGAVVMEVTIRRHMYFFEDVLKNIESRRDESKKTIIPSKSAILITDEATEVISSIVSHNRKVYGTLTTQKFHDTVPSLC